MQVNPEFLSVFNLFNAGEDSSSNFKCMYFLFLLFTFYRLPPCFTDIRRSFATAVVATFTALKEAAI